jgi:hypothetical protein
LLTEELLAVRRRRASSLWENAVRLRFFAAIWIYVVIQTGGVAVTKEIEQPVPNTAARESRPTAISGSSPV